MPPPTESATGALVIAWVFFPGGLPQKLEVRSVKVLDAKWGPDLLLFQGGLSGSSITLWAVQQGPPSDIKVAATTNGVSKTINLLPMDTSSVAREYSNVYEDGVLGRHLTTKAGHLTFSFQEGPARASSSDLHRFFPKSATEEQRFSRDGRCIGIVTGLVKP